MDTTKLVVICLMAYAGFYGWSHRPISQPDGVMVSSEPVQAMLPSQEQHPIPFGNAVLKPMAEYSLTGRVLSTERYWLDTKAKVSPVDLALGWGVMSDSEVLSQLDITQSDRLYSYSWRGTPSVDAKTIVHNSANVHIIPADPSIKKIASGLRVGQVVSLKGSLVNVDFPSGGEWKSSLSRDDTGNEGSEVMFVTEINVLDR